MPESASRLRVGIPFADSDSDSDFARVFALEAVGVFPFCFLSTAVVCIGVLSVGTKCIWYLLRLLSIYVAS